MTVSLKHAFTSNVADSGDTTLVQPSNWNAEHTLTAAADTLLGAVTSGAVTEITCTAAGRALLDDATASAQRTTLGLGTTDSPTFGSSITLNSSSSFLPQMILNNTAADSTGPYWLTKKLRGSSPANSGDSLGTFIFQSNGNDGLTYNSAFLASISEGAGATWHAAGFGFNTINTSGVTARRMRIRASGTVAIGTDGYDNCNLYIAKAVTGSIYGFGSLVETTFQSDVTTLATGYATSLSTAAASYTVTTLQHYRAYQVTIGAGSTVTEQHGFWTANTLIGATSNYAFFASNQGTVGAGKTGYAFYSGMSIATGGGTTWAFYGAGTAPSVFSGAIGVGSTSISNVNIIFGRSITGSTSAHSIFNALNVASDVTANAYVNRTFVGTQAAAFTLTSLFHYSASQATIGAGSTVTNQYGFSSGSGNIDASLNYAFIANDTAAVTAGKVAYGFYSGINSATGGGTAWAFYGGGTAPSVFSGAIGVGNSVLTGFNIRVTRNITGATSFYSIRTDSTILSDVTASSVSFSSAVGTQAAAFTLSSLTHYSAEQATLGAGSSVTVQYGFISRESLVGATVNYGFFATNTAAVTAGKTAHGFYSAINSATGGGTTYAFYSAGTAPNVFAGTMSIGTTVATNVNLYLTKTITGSVNSFGIASDGVIQSDVTSVGVGVGSTVGTAAASFTLSNLSVFRAAQGTFGAGSTVTAQYGYNATASLIGATNNYAFSAGDTAAVTTGKSAFGFYSGINIATGGGTTYALYAAGTAPSIFAGNVGIGSTSLTNVIFRVSKAITGSTTSYGVFTNSTVQSDVTASAVFYYSGPSTAAAAFTLGNLTHYFAAIGTIGAGSSITNQYGFRGDAALIDATTNYSFYAANTAAVTSGKTSYGFYSNVAVASGGGTTWSFYSASTGWNYFSGPTITADVLWVNAPAPAAKTTTATLTAAEIKTGIISATGTSYTLTMPLATDIDSSFSGLPSTTNIGFDFSVVNAASGTVTIAVNTGITNVGSLSVSTGTSAAFRLRRTAANTYIIYRLS